MIFQDPIASLDPRMTVSEIISEGLVIRGVKDKKYIEEQVYKVLETVGLVREHAGRYPHEFSGGQRQRIGMARALSVDPEFIICDEPISALDVSIQAQVLNMLNELQDNLGLTYLFIAHDLSVVKYLSDRVVVMYLGTLVETATSEELYSNPMHPYTKALLSSIPEADPDKAKENRRIPIKGEISSPINPKNCCRFASRCEFATERCFNEVPVAREMAPGHIVACHLMEDK
jgi:oligopeptide transport system ATP-binding protein